MEQDYVNKEYAVIKHAFLMYNSSPINLILPICICVAPTAYQHEEGGHYFFYMNYFILTWYTMKYMNNTCAYKIL